MDTNFRKLNTWEVEIFKKLFEVKFPEIDVLKKQLTYSLVKEVDENGSLKFKIRKDVTLVEKIKKRVPVEAEVNDKDGVKIHILLHVLDGKIDELEIYKENSSKIIREVKPSELKVLVFEGL
jgi:hypothetical protein